MRARAPQRLDGAFEATLLAAAIVAARRGHGSRVTVYLTLTGGGAFGNRSMWILDAVRRALLLLKDHPLDV